MNLPLQVRLLELRSWGAVQGNLLSAAVALINQPPQKILAQSEVFFEGTKFDVDGNQALFNMEKHGLKSIMARRGTLALVGAQDVSAPFLALQTFLRGHFGHREFNLNVYVTGADTPGASEHEDGHDVAALQLTGTKRWLTGPGGTHPVVNGPGHMLVIKAGWPHATVSVGTGVSIHVSVNCRHLFTQDDAFPEKLAAALEIFATGSAAVAQVA